MRKTILTAAGPNMWPVLTECSLPSFDRFAKRHGYTIRVEELSQDDGDRWSPAAKAARWQKMKFIHEAVQHTDVLAWFDADALILRTDRDILCDMDPTAFQGLVLHSVPRDNRTNPNTGVWVIKNCEKALHFLDKVIEIGMPEGPWADQGAVLRALGWTLGNEHYHGAQPPKSPNEFVQGTAWLPFGWNHPYLERLVGRPPLPDPFVVHFMAMPAADRLMHMRDLVQQHAEPVG